MKVKAKAKAKAKKLPAKRVKAPKSPPIAPIAPVAPIAPIPIEPDIDSPEGFRSGYVAIVGRPNVGKSTLLNQLLGQKIAATTHKPQTTRKNILGVLNPKGAQVILRDTPGFHQAKGPLNRFMVEQVRDALKDTDLVAYAVEARSDGAITPGNDKIVGELKLAAKPVVVVINKIDQVKRKDDLLLQMQAYQAALGDVCRDIVPISAMYKDGLEVFVRAVASLLPVGVPFFPDDTITDQSERAIAGEMIREKVILETKQELPYACAVTIEGFEDLRPKLVRIAATIHVERPSQKAIVIGKGGTKLKEIGQRARKEVEHFVGCKVYLELHVRVSERWSESDQRLAELVGGREGE